MNFAKIIDGELVYAPSNYTTDKGNIIVNFNRSEILMKKYGFKEVIEFIPTYNEFTEYLIMGSIIENEDSIVITFEKKPMEVSEAEESIEEKIERLEEANTELELAMAEMYEVVLGGV